MIHGAYNIQRGDLVWADRHKLPFLHFHHFHLLAKPGIPPIVTFAATDPALPLPSLVLPRTLYNVLSCFLGVRRYGMYLQCGSRLRSYEGAKRGVLLAYTLHALTSVAVMQHTWG